MPTNPCPLFFSFLFLSLSFLFSFPYNSSALHPQGQTLLYWKQTLNSSSSSLESLLNWNPNDETPCGWFGITCNFKNQVIELNLRYVDLLGQIPSNFTSLLSLKKLTLSQTNLSGSIPKEIGSLSELSTLDLSGNALFGKIPIEICNLQKLEQLYLNSNRLLGPIPDQIGNLSSLKELFLYDNQLSGKIPSSVGKLKQLEVIRAGGNKNFEGILPKEIGNCTNLVFFGLAETSISGSIPSSIGLLKKLQTLAIYTALLSGEIPPEIGYCTELQNIYLFENSLTGSIPRSLQNLKRLKNLLVWQNNLEGILPPEISDCKELSMIDISMNSFAGSIPATIGNLTSLKELQLSTNRISGAIPVQIGNCIGITHIELDNNEISGTIPEELGNLENLIVLFLWGNKIEGRIPLSISNCKALEAMDLSQNFLTGPIPKQIFQLKKLNELLLLSNNLSGEISAEIGNCSSLIRFRASNNMITGTIPHEIGKLKKLSFLDLGVNRITGTIPVEISGCRNLTFLDLHSNSITGTSPEGFNKLVSLQFVDFSNNFMGGTLNSSLGSLSSLTKLILAKNRFIGPIPNQLGFCLELQLLDLSANQLSGTLPRSLGNIPTFEIALNLSWNQLTGEIPEEYRFLDKLGVLDISHNYLTGDLQILAEMQNLVLLNVSDNNFSGGLPNTSFFAKLPRNVFSGNPNLCISGELCGVEKRRVANHTITTNIAISMLICIVCVLVVAAFYILHGSRRLGRRGFGREHDDNVNESNESWGSSWDVTLYKKLELSIDDVIKCLTTENMIGHGRSGVVYRASMSSGLTIAVKQFKLSEKVSMASFSSEIATLARIRHRNIVRLLGWGANQKMKLLFYDYLPKGNLGVLLDEDCLGLMEWDTRLNIALDVAEGLAYLHHDCVPAILHRDVKTHNILLGDQYEACLADFGLARFVEPEHNHYGSFSSNSLFAGSYGYMAPEYGCMLKITSKSDVFSYGVVLLEIITGKKPVDPSFPDGRHVVQWVRDHLKNEKDPLEILDPKLKGHLETQIEEMFQALGISLLCTSNQAKDRPTMKDVVVLLKEIRHVVPMIGNESKRLKKSESSLYNLSSPVKPSQSIALQGSSRNYTFGYSSSSAGFPSTNYQIT